MSKRSIPCILAIFLVACGGQVPTAGDADGPGSEVDLPSDVGVRDAAPEMQDTVGDVGATDIRDGGARGDATDGDASRPPPMPRQVQPCRNADCWEQTLTASRCGRASIDENYHTGNYNVHRWATTIFDARTNSVDMRVRAGGWKPALVVTRRDGTVLYDGEVGLQSADLTVGVETRTDNRVRIRFATDRDVSVYVFATARKTLRSDFVERIPTAAEYTLGVESTCQNPPPECRANGHEIAEPACGWLKHVAREVVPNLAGSRSERLTDAARVAWWALKEGVMSLENPIVYSNCHFESGGDMRIGPLKTCPSGQAWQVGLSGVQVPGESLSELKTTVQNLYPNSTVDDVLRETAKSAKLTQNQLGQVVNSSGRLRVSWLLRNSAVGFSRQVDPVTAECIDGTRSWCFGTGWETTRKFAPDEKGARQAIRDIRQFLDAVAP